MQGRTEPRERKVHPCRCRRYHSQCSCNGLNQLAKVHGDGSRPPGMVGATEDQAKEEARGESKETEQVSGKRGETEGTHQC